VRARRRACPLLAAGRILELVPVVPRPDSAGPTRHNHPAISRHGARSVAVAAKADTRTVYGYLWALSQTAVTRERIAAALVVCGYAHLVRKSEQRNHTPLEETRPPAALANGSAPRPANGMRATKQLGR